MLQVINQLTGCHLTTSSDIKVMILEETWPIQGGRHRSMTNSTVCETGGRTIEEDRSTETRETPYEGVLNTHESETNMLETPGRDVTGGARPDAHVTMRKKQGVKETPPATSEVVD